MKHLKSGRTLGRSRQHRRAMLRGMCRELLRHESLVTTSAKAKELKRFVEPLLTQGKAEMTLHVRRKLLQHLGSSEALDQLLELAGERQGRAGGYIRLTRLPETRSDGAPQVRVQLVEATKNT